MYKFKQFMLQAQKQKKCPPGYKFDKKLQVCVPVGVTRYYPYLGGVRNDTPNSITDGDTIYVEVPIFFTLAALGGKIKIPTIRGEKEIEIRRNIRDKEQILIRSEGVRNIHTKRVGDMIAQVKIVYPDKLTDEQEELLQKLHESFTKTHEEPHKGGIFQEAIDAVKKWFN
jgi:molecular chaperone DnaJ